MCDMILVDKNIHSPRNKHTYVWFGIFRLEIIAIRMCDVYITSSVLNFETVFSIVSDELFL